MMTECIALVSWRELTRALLHLRRYLVDRGGIGLAVRGTVLHRRHSSASVFMVTMLRIPGTIDR